MCVGWRCVQQAIIGDVRHKVPSTSSDPVGVLYIINFLKRLTCYLDLNDS